MNTNHTASIGRVLISEEEVLAGVDRVAESITREYGERGVTVVSVLKGSCLFVSDLIRRLPLALELDFAMASSYRTGTTSARLDIKYLPPEEDIRGRSVLLVDDILDTGRTLKALEQAFLELGAIDVKTCVFLNKRARREVEFEADFCCFEVPNSFVVGYGLDLAGRYRNLPYVACVEADVAVR